MYCVCWHQCKNSSAFLPCTPGEGLFENFCVSAQDLPANPSHHRVSLSAHIIRGETSEKEEERGYDMGEGEYSGDDRGE